MLFLTSQMSPLLVLTSAKRKRKERERYTELSSFLTSLRLARILGAAYLPSSRKSPRRALILQEERRLVPRKENIFVMPLTGFRDITFMRINATRMFEGEAKWFLQEWGFSEWEFLEWMFKTSVLIAYIS